MPIQDTPENLAHRIAIAAELGIKPEDLGLCHHGTKLFMREKDEKGHERGHRIVAWLTEAGEWSTHNPFAAPAP